MFAIEIIVELRHLNTIKKTTVRGIPLWFTQCLELCTSSKGGDIVYVDELFKHVKSSDLSPYCSFWKSGFALVNVL
jgi:hypothetical protein